jgi:hypothetical protein
MELREIYKDTFPIRSQIFTIPNSLVISKSPNQVPNRYRFRTWTHRWRDMARWRRDTSVPTFYVIIFSCGTTGICIFMFVNGGLLCIPEGSVPESVPIRNLVWTLWNNQRGRDCKYLRSYGVLRRWQRKLQSSMELREIYRTRSPYDRKYLLSRTLWLFQRVQTKFRIGTDSGTDPSGMQRRPPFTNMKIQIPVVPQEKLIKIWAHVKCGDRRVPSSSCHIPPTMCPKLWQFY